MVIKQIKFRDENLGVLNRELIAASIDFPGVIKVFGVDPFRQEIILEYLEGTNFSVFFTLIQIY